LRETGSKLGDREKGADRSTYPDNLSYGNEKYGMETICEWEGRKPGRRFLKYG